MEGSAEDSMEEIASEFLVRTCQLLPKSDADGLTDRIQLGNVSGGKPLRYTIFCGSSAEFLIRPVQSVVDDNDSLFWESNVLAFTDDIPVLPNDVCRIHDTIICLKLEPYPNFPGFVRLGFIGVAVYDWTVGIHVYGPRTLQNKWFRLNLSNDSV